MKRVKPRDLQHADFLPALAVFSAVFLALLSAISYSSSTSHYILSASLTLSDRIPPAITSASAQGMPAPSILSASVEPLKVRPGDLMQISAQVSDPSGVLQVSALMPHELGSDLLNLSLFSGTIYNGTWSAFWRVHDTLAKKYTTKITATNFPGAQSFYHIDWSDPPAWYSSSWPYRRNVTLSPATPVANYQVKVDLTAANFNYAQLSYPATGQDIRFTGSDGTTLQDYWIESWVNGGTSTIWVEAAASGTSTLYMYYGNSGANSTSNGSAVFDAYDFTTFTEVDTANNRLDVTASRATFTNLYRTETIYLYKQISPITDFRYDVEYIVTGGSSKANNDGTVFFGGLADSANIVPLVSNGLHIRNYDCFHCPAYRLYMQRRLSGAEAAIPPGDNYANIATGTLYYVTITRIGTQVTMNVYTDAARTTHAGGSPRTDTVDPAVAFNYVLAVTADNSGGTGYASGYVQNIRVRKYASSEPSVLSVGAEESLPILSSVSNNAPVPVKGGNSFNVTPSGQNDLQSDNLYFYCRLDSAGATSANTNCTQGNAVYSAPYSTMLCTVSAPVDTAAHTYFCRVYDGLFYSSEQSTGITTDSTPPAVTGVSSAAADAVYGSGMAIPVSVAFSEPVNVTGTPRLLLEAGVVDRYAVYAGGSGTNTLSFNYVPQPNDSSNDLDYVSTSALELNGGSINDSAGNPAVLALPAPGAAGSLGANKNIAVYTCNRCSSLTVSSSLTMVGSFEYDLITVTGTGTLTTLQGYGLNLSANNLTIFSGGRIDVSGMGYAGGVGPGVGGVSYGSLTGPDDLGSGGGGASPGTGGGLVRLIVSNALTINGSIEASGTSPGSQPWDGSAAGSGGSGGAVFINATVFAGTGSISANGGNGANKYKYNVAGATGGGYGGTGGAGNWGTSEYGDANGGGGSGGRIAIYYTTKTHAGTISAFGGIGASGGGNTAQSGGGGTIYLKSASQPYGELIVDNNGASGAGTPLNSSAYPAVFDKINVSNGAILSSAIPTLLLNSTVLLGNGRVSVDSNNLVLRASNISLNISSTSGQLNITSQGNFTPSGSITTSSGSIKIWYGSGAYDYCDVSGASISAGAQFYYSFSSSTSAYRCAKLLLDQFSVLDSNNNVRYLFNKNESFYPSARIREYDSYNGQYLNPGGSWNLSVYASTGSVSNGKYALSNVTSYLWRTQAFSENSLNSYSFYANLSGSSAVGMRAYAASQYYNYSVKSVSVSEGLSPALANPGDNITLSGQATLLPDGAPVANNPISFYLDGQQLSYPNISCPSNWWNCSWPYRKAITINGSNNGLTDYQTQLYVNWTSGMNANFSGLRFSWLNATSGQEQNISYWLENYTAANATVWIKVPSLPANSTSAVFMYYGNPSAASASNVNNTFVASTATSAIPGCSLGEACIVSSSQTISSSGTYGHPYVRINPGVVLNVTGDNVIVNFTAGMLDIQGALVSTGGGFNSGGGAYIGSGSGGSGGSGGNSGGSGGSYGGGGGGGRRNGGPGGGGCAGQKTGWSYGGGGGCNDWYGAGLRGSFLSINASTLALRQWGKIELKGGDSPGRDGGGGSLFQAVVKKIILEGNISVYGGNGSYASASDLGGGGGGGALAYINYTSAFGVGFVVAKGGPVVGGGTYYPGTGGDATIILPEVTNNSAGSGLSGGTAIMSLSAYNQPSVVSIGAEQNPAMTNSTGGYFYSFSAPQIAGIHTVKVNLTDPFGIYGENSTNLSVRIPFSSPSAKGVVTNNANLNINESANLSVLINSSNIGADNLSRVWANVSWSSGKQTVQLSGSALGGSWSGLFSNTSRLDAYNVTFFANLSGGFRLYANASAQFFVKALNITAAYDNIIYDSETSVFSGTVYREPEHSITGSSSQAISLSDSSFSNGTHSGTKNSSGLQLQYSGFQYRRQINVSNPSSALTDYQIPINLTTALYNNSGLVGSWHFSEGSGSSAADSSGNGNTGTLTNFDWNANSNWTQGKFGGGLKFDGSNDYLSVPGSGGLSVSDAVTIEAWVETSSAGSSSETSATVGFKKDPSPTKGTLSNNNRTFSAGTGYSSVVLAKTFAAEQDFEMVTYWAHDYRGVGMVYGPAVSHTDWTGYSSDGLGPYWGAIGTTGFPSGYSGTYFGQYHSPIAGGGAATTGYYFKHKRTGNTLSLQYSSSASGPWTNILADIAIASSNKVAIGMGEASGNEVTPLSIISLSYEGGIQKVGAYGLDFNGVRVVGQINNNTVNASVSGGWNHLVLTYDKNLASGQQKLYVNGVLQAEANLTAAITANSNDLNIGSFFNGTIDEVRIYNRALNATEIQQQYNATKSRLDYADLRFSQPYTIYETPVSISSSTSLTDYQVLINITNQTVLSHMRADGADLRFFNSQTSNPYAQTTLPYWIENISSTRALVWVKTNVSSSGSTLYLYYGNVSAQAQSNGSKTFEFFDDFSGDLSKWTTSRSISSGRLLLDNDGWLSGAKTVNTFARPLIMEWDEQGTATNLATQSGYMDGNYVVWYNSVGATWHKDESDSAAHATITGTYYGNSVAQDTSNHRLRIDVLPASGYTWYYDGTSKATTTVGASSNMYLQFTDGWTSGNFYIDNVRVRKYASPEPNATIGSETIKSSGLEAPLSYWLESDNQAWVRVPSLPANANSSVFMYYGNPGANSTGNGSAAFVFFDDFEGDLGRWDQRGTPTITSGEVVLDAGDQIIAKASIPYGVAVETRVGSGGISAATGERGSFSGASSLSGNSTDFGSDNPTNAQYADWDIGRNGVITLKGMSSDGATVDYNGPGMGSVAENDLMGVRIETGRVTYYRNGVQQGTSTTAYVPTALLYPVLNSRNLGNSQTFKIREIRVRKYSSPEPSALMGAEQYTPTAGSYLSAPYQQANPVLSITPSWSAGGNVSVEISANNGTDWISVANGNFYSSGAGIGSGSMLRFRVNLSTDGSSFPVLYSLTLNITTVQPLYLQANASAGSVPLLNLLDSGGAYQFAYSPQNESAVTYRTIFLNATDFDGIRGNASPQVKVYPNVNARVISDYNYYNLGDTVKVGAYIEFNNTEISPRDLVVAGAYLLNNSNGSGGSTALGITNATTFSGQFLLPSSTSPNPANAGEWTAWIGTEANASRWIGSNSLRVNPYKLIVDTLPAGEAKPGQNYTVRILQKNTYDNAGTTLLSSNATLYFRGMSYTVPTDVQNSIPSDPAECPNGMRVESGCGGYYRIVVNATVNATGGLVLSALKEAELFVDYPYWDSNYSDLTFRPYRVRVTVDNRFGYAKEYLMEVNGSQLAGAGATLSQIKPSSIRVVDPDTESVVQEEVWGSSIPYNITSTASIGAADKIRWLANLSENARKVFYIYYTTTDTTPPQYTGISGIKHPNVSLKYEKSDVLIMLVTYNLEPPIYRRAESINTSLLFYTPHPAQTAIYYYLYGPSGEYQYVPWYAPGSISQEWNSLSRLILVGTNASFGEWRVKFQVTDQQDGKSSTYEKKFWVGQVEVSETVSPPLVNVNGKAVVDGSVINSANSLPLAGVDVNLTISGPVFRNASGDYQYLRKEAVQTGVLGSYQYNFTPTIPGEYSIGSFVNVNGNRGYNNTNLSVRLTVNVSVDIPVPEKNPLAPVDVLVAVDNNGDSIENVTCGFYYSVAESGSLPSKVVSINPRAYSPANNLWNILPNRIGDYLLDVNCSHRGYQAGYGNTSFTRYNLSLAPSLDTVYVQELFALSGNVSRNGVGLNGTVYLIVNGSEFWSVNATSGNGSYSRSGLVLQKPGYYNLSAVYVSPNGKGVSFSGLHVRYYADSGLGVDSDSYKANRLVNISLSSNNFANVSWSPLLQFRVFNGSVNVSNWTETFSFAPLGSVAYNSVWNTSHTPPGSYNVSVVLVDPEGLVASEAFSGFVINTTIGAVLSASLDRPDYNMSRLVNISGLVERTGNVEVPGFLKVRVENMDSGCLYCGYCGLVFTLDNLSTSTAGGAYPFAYAWNTSTYHSGNYSAFATFNYTDEYGAGHLLYWNRSFAINSNPLLVVSLSVNKAVFNVSDTITVNVSIENVGNAYVIGSLWMNVTDSSGARRVSSPDFFTGDDTTRVLCNRIAGGNSDFKSYSMGLSQVDYANNYVAGFREEGNYSFRATVDYSGRRAWGGRNITVLGFGSVSASGFDVWYPEFPGKLYANEVLGFNLRVENKGNLFFRNMTADYLIYCSNLSGAGSVRAYSSFNQSGVDRFDLPVSTAGRFSGASWNSAHTPVNKSAGTRACSVNALLWSPAIYANCPCVSGGVCYWWASSSLVAGCDFGVSQASSFTLYATYGAVVNVSGGGVFGAGDAVLFNLSVNNSGNVPLNGSLAAGLFSGNSLIVNGSCNNGSLLLDVDGGYVRGCELELVNVLSGNYSLKAVYSFDGGSASGSAPLEVLGQVKGRVNVSLDGSSVDMGGVLNITGWAKNTGNLLLTGALELKAIGYENRSISSWSVSLPMGGVHNFNQSWNVGTLSSGAYVLRASLNYSTENGSRVAFTDVPFTVNSLVRVNVSLGLSNLSLGALEVLSVNASLANTGNYLFNNLDVLFSVVSFNGSAVYSASSPVSGFWPNMSASKTFSWNTARHPPGAYRAIITAKNASWNASESGNLTVLETRRVAVKISTSKATYLEGEPVDINGNVTSTGNVKLYGSFNLTLQNEAGTNIDVTEAVWKNQSIGVGEVFSFSKRYSAASRDYGKPLALAVSEGVLPISLYTAAASYSHAYAQSNSTYFVVGGISIKITPPPYPAHTLRKFESDLNVVILGANVSSLDAIKSYIKSLWFTKDGVNWVGDGMDYTRQAKDSLGALGQYNYSINITAPSEKGTYSMCLRMQDNSGREGIGCAGVDVSYYSYTVELVTSGGDVQNIGKGVHTGLPHKYVSIFGSGFASGLVFGGSDFYNVYWNECGANKCIGLTQEVIDGKAVIPFTIGSEQNLVERMALIEAGEFWGQPNPSFAYPLGGKYRVKVAVRYPNIILNGTESFPQGSYEVVIVNKGKTNGTPVLEIRSR